MAHRVTLIPGDGVGPEVTAAARRVLEATGLEFDWDVQEAGAKVMEEHGTPLPEAVLDSIRCGELHYQFINAFSGIASYDHCTSEVISEKEPFGYRKVNNHVLKNVVKLTMNFHKSSACFHSI